MGEVVNLRLIRKRKRREDARALADENRTRHSQAKIDRQLHDAQAKGADRHLDGHRLGKTDIPD